MFSYASARNVQGNPGADAALPSYPQHPLGRALLPHARGIPAGMMAQQGCTHRRTQHSRFHTLLVWPGELHGQEPGAGGDANGALLGVAAVPVLKGSWS